MPNFTYHFSGKIVQHQMRNMTFSVVFLPAKLAKELPLDDYPRLRVDGAVNETPFNLALQPTGGKKKWHLLMSKRFLKSCGAKLGDRVAVGFEIADQEAVNVPVELTAALETDNQAAHIWSELSAGKQRGFAYLVDSAKRSETRMRRADEVLQLIRELG